MPILATIQSNTSYYAIQWDPVPRPRAYNIYRSVSGGAYTLYAVSCSHRRGRLDRRQRAWRQDDRHGGWDWRHIVGTDLTGAATASTAGTAIATDIQVQPDGTTTGTGGTGTYPSISIRR